MTYDLLIKNVRVVRPQGNDVHEQDIAIRNGKFAKITGGMAASIQALQALQTIARPEGSCLQGGEKFIREGQVAGGERREAIERRGTAQPGQ